MAEHEDLTITLSAETSALVRSVVDTGDFASASELVGVALRDWASSRARAEEDLAALRSDIAVGLADIGAGRVRDFEVARVIARGRTLSAARSTSG